MTSSIRSNAYRWLAAVFAVALVLGLLVGSNQNTAQAIDPGETDIAYVADGYNFPDALMGATLAGLNTAPMLGVRSPKTGDVVPPETAAELDRLTNNKASKLDTIYVFGGSAAVSDKVVGELGAWANNVTRIFGADRFGTMAEISKALPSKARDSDLLDGMDSTDFLGTTDKAADSELLDGFDSSELGLLDTTVLPADCTSLANVTGTYQKIGDIGTFDVVDVGTTIEATFQGGIYVGSVTDGTGVVFELRIDDAPSSVGRARAVVQASQAGERINASIVGVFDGLATGTHSVSLWARVGAGNDASSAIYDPGCWASDKVLVKELR